MKGWRKGKTGYRVTSSAPGRPPHAHKPKDYIRQGLAGRFGLHGGGGYAFDMNKQSVVIGPGLINQKNAGQLDKLEYGGSITIRSYEWRRTKPTDGSQRRNERRFVRRTVRVAPRPFMGPAQRAGNAKLPEFWAKASRT